MSCIHGLCTSFLAEALRGVHTEKDTYKLALYTERAQLGGATERYAPAGECAGPGYTAGGQRLEGYDVLEDGNAVVLTFLDARWPKATITGAVGGLIYNASKGNRAVGVIAFGGAMSSANSTFDVEMPLPTAGTGLFVIN